MRSPPLRRRIDRLDCCFRLAIRLSVAAATSVVCFSLLSFDPVLALSTTNPITTTKKPADIASAGGSSVANEKIPNLIKESDLNCFPTQTTSSPITPNERSDLLNKHLRRELLEQQQSDGIIGIDTNNITSGDIMEAALLSTRGPSRMYDPRFGRPALRAYRSFVYSDKHATTDPHLLDGLAIKTAKQIRNMIKQTTLLAQGIDSPPKNCNKLPQENNRPQHFRTKIANSIAKGERRALERSHRNLREVCTGCSRPFNLCLCEVLEQWNSKSSSKSATSANVIKTSELMVRSKVIVLQHPNEFRKKHTSTVPLLKLVLGEKNVRIKVGYEFTMKDIVRSDCSNNNDGSQEERPIMLFPGPDAIDLDKYVETRQEQQQQQQSDDASDCNPNNEGTKCLPPTVSNEKQQQSKYTLVLIDGTWSEAKRIIRRSPEVLEGCQMVQFAFPDDLDEEGTNRDHPLNANADPIDDLPSPQSSWPTQPKSDSDKATKSRSIYHAMRKEPEEHCLSTLEASGEALKILEGSVNGPKLQEALTSVLSKHVELHLKNAREASQSRHNRDTTSRDSKLRRSKEIEQSIYGGNDVKGGGNSSSNRRSRSSVRPSRLGNRYGKSASLQAVQPTTIASTPTRLLEVDSNTSVTIRRLTHEDIPEVDAWWDNGGMPKSVMTITRSIDSDYRLGIGASLGIVDENTGALVACIIRYESGPLGILHVSEELRGKGYATALLREATEALSKANRSRDIPLECTAFIKDGNIASQKVFAKVGFVRENPNAKKGSGKRRANRKWIYPALQAKEGVVPPS